MYIVTDYGLLLLLQQDIIKMCLTKKGYYEKQFRKGKSTQFCASSTS